MEDLEEPTIDVDHEVPEAVDKYSCVCSPLTLTSKIWLVTFQTLLIYKSSLSRSKREMHWAVIFNNKENHWVHSGSKGRKKTRLFELRVWNFCFHSLKPGLCEARFLEAAVKETSFEANCSHSMTAVAALQIHQHCLKNFQSFAK